MLAWIPWGGSGLAHLFHTSRPVSWGILLFLSPTRQLQWRSRAAQQVPLAPVAHNRSAPVQKHAMLSLLLGAVALGSAPPVHAQSLFGSRGPASQIGSNSVGSFAGRGTTLGTSISSGLGGLGTRGSSLTGGLTSGLTTPSGLTIGGNTSAGQVGRASGFIGRDDNAGRFVGDQRIGQQLPRGANMRRFGSRSGRSTRANQRFGSRGLGASASRIRFRPQQRIAFRYQAPQPGQLAATVRLRLEKLQQRGTPLQGLKISADAQGTVVLQGRVESEEARRLAVALIRLEPGVRRVEDRLEVSPGR